MRVVHLGFRSGDAILEVCRDPHELRMMRTSRSAIIRYFAPKSPFFMSLGASRLKRVALVPAVLVLASMSFLSCGYSSSYYKPPSGLTTRVLASQSVSSGSTSGGLIIINGENDTLPRATEIGGGTSPGLMAISPDRATVLAFDSATNNIEVINSKMETSTGNIQLPGPTTSMVVLASGSAYAAVPAAAQHEVAPGAVVVESLSSGTTAATISVPNAQTVVASPDGTQLLVFSSDSDAVTIMSPLLVNTVNPVTTTVAGFDRPVYGIFSADGSTAYILNCGAECGGTQASVQLLNLNTTPATLGALLSVNGATFGFLSGSTLYVAGNGTPTGPLCGSIQNAAPTSAQYCGTLDLVDLTTLQDPYFNNPAVEIAIPDGYHDRMDMSVNGQLFIGSHTCTNVGDVNSPQGEVRGCLAIFDTTKPENATAILPPDNGDVTGLQSFTSRYVEYVAEGGKLRVYDTTIDSLLLNSFIETGTIVINGQITDVKAIDFF
jgi:DNA-binding beta-propeller fold protein YncE